MDDPFALARKLDVRAIQRRHARTHCYVGGKDHNRTEPQEDVTTDEAELGIAVDRYKDETGRRFPALSELLAILKALGYRRQEKQAMPSLQNFSVTPGQAAQVNALDFTIEAQVLSDDNPPKVLADFTGANALHFPGAMATLTSDQQSQLLASIVNTLIYMKAGVQ